MRKRRNFWHLILSIISLIGLVYLIIFVKPDQNLQALIFKISPLPLFFVLVFLFLTSIISFVFRNLRWGIFVGLFIVGLLILMLYHFAQPFFIIMLLALFFVLELVFSHKR